MEVVHREVPRARRLLLEEDAPERLPVDRGHCVGASQLAGDPRDRPRVAGVVRPPPGVPPLALEEQVEEGVLGRVRAVAEFATQPLAEGVAEVGAEGAGRAVAVVPALEHAEGVVPDPGELYRQAGVPQHLPLVPAAADDEQPV